MRKIIFSLLVISIMSCKEDLINKSYETNSNSEYKKIIENFFKVYSERKDSAKIMSFYIPNAEYEDMLYDAKHIGIDIGNNFTWGDPLFKKDKTEFITIEEIIAKDSLVVAKYISSQYYYNNNLIPATQWTSWFYLNKEGKIKKQINYAAYPLSEVDQVIKFKRSVDLNSN